MNLKIIGLIAPLILIGAFAAPTILGYVSNDEDPLQYDDYFTTTAASATGALELVTSGSTTYAHANSIGEGTLTYADGHTDTYTVTKAEIDVLFLTGQSNAAYNSAYAQVDVANAELDHIPNGMAYYYGSADIPVQGTDLINGSSSGPWDLSDCTMRSMTDLDGTYKLGHIEAALASVICNSTGHKLYVINGGQNGRSITAWVGTGNGMTLDLQILTEGLDAINQDYYDIHLRGYIWLQGEADKDKSESWYIEQWDKVNSVFAEHDLVPCYIIQVNKSMYANPANAQETIVNTHNNVYMGSTASQTFTVDNGLLWANSTAHYTQKGYDIVGTETAKVIVSHIPVSADVDSAMASLFPAIVFVMIITLVLGAVSIVYTRSK